LGHTLTQPGGLRTVPPYLKAALLCVLCVLCGFNDDTPRPMPSESAPGSGRDSGRPAARCVPRGAPPASPPPAGRGSPSGPAPGSLRASDATTPRGAPATSRASGTRARNNRPRTRPPSAGERRNLAAPVAADVRRLHLRSEMGGANCEQSEPRYRGSYKAGEGSDDASRRCLGHGTPAPAPARLPGCPVLRSEHGLRSRGPQLMASTRSAWTFTNLCVFSRTSTCGHARARRA